MCNTHNKLIVYFVYNNKPCERNREELMMEIKKTASEIAAKLLNQQNEFTENGGISGYPDPDTIIGVIKKIRAVIFPGLYNVPYDTSSADVWMQDLLTDIYQELSGEIKTALLKQHNDKDAVLTASEISKKLLEQLPDIQRLLFKDAQAGFDGDPAARSVDEVILTYPGFYAVFVYRVAHVLFLKNVPLIPRMMSEHAHSITGIDIHPGAEIGEYFFIDHGTGVVIGETTVIGNHVKLYQGVTLGALSTKKGQKLAGSKRHPTIEDNVTIYSGASILGGETVIGKGSTIGGNVFITKSVTQDTLPPFA